MSTANGPRVECGPSARVAHCTVNDYLHCDQHNIDEDCNRSLLYL